MAIVLATPLPVGTGLDLNGIWLNAADDLADVMSFERVGNTVSASPSTQAEVRQLATRRRVVRSGTKTYTSFALTLLHCTAAQRQWLEDHVGVLLCLRDGIGSKIYGIYAEAPREVSTLPVGGLYFTDVKLTFEQVDHSEASE